jgi:outer membrane protein W
MKNIFAALIILAVIASGSCMAQPHKDFLYSLSWEASKPLSNNSFLDKTSFAGGKFEFRKFIDRNFSLGVFINWNSYYQYTPRTTYTNTEQSQAVTTDMYRYIYTLPFGITGHYYFDAGKQVKPYVGLALGPQYSEQNLYFNIYQSTSKNWGFLLRPELGVIVMPRYWHNAGILLGSGYSFSTNKNNSLGIKNLQNLTFQVGLVYSE